MTDGVGFKTFSGSLGGVCDAFPAPQYQVLGKTPYDQEKVDKWTEAGVAGCKWERPGARPAEFDVAPAPIAVKAKPAKKKPSIWNNVRSKFGLRKRID